VIRLKSKNFVIILFTQIIGLLASGILSFAMALHILDTTGSAAIFSTILSISFIPTIILGPISGALADRLPEKALLMFADTTKAIIVTLLGIFLFTDNAPALLIAIVLTIITTLTTWYHPIVSAILPKILNKEELIKAAGMVQSVKSLARFAAPALGGLVYSLIGIYTLVIGIGVLYVISMLSNFFLQLPPKKKEFEGGILNGIGHDLKAGLIYITKTDKEVRDLAVMAGVVVMIFYSSLTVAFPFIGRVILEINEQQFGVAQAVTGIATLFGALFATRPKIKRFLTRSHLTGWVFAMALVSLPIGISMIPGLNLSNELSFFIFTSGFFLTMAAIAIINMIKFTTIQKNAPQDMVGKVIALSMSITVIGIPVAQLIKGELLERVVDGYLSLHVLFLSLSVITFIVGFIRCFLKRLREGKVDGKYGT